MDKARLAAMFGADDEDETPFQTKPLDDQKLAQYSQGTVRKSRREKDKEAAEMKRRQEEEEAAKVYNEFLDEFDSKGKSGGKGFVRGAEDSGAPPKQYEHSFRGREEASSSKQREDERPPSPEHSKPKPRGKRAMDTFLEELKRDQAERESRLKKYSSSTGNSISALAAYESQRGSKDRGDPATSNIFVSNLPSNITEATLGNFFAKHGPIGSVKIMWPRGDPVGGPGSDINHTRRAKSAGLSGFVSFMKRKDAEVAVREMDGYDWGGYILKVGWSKAVPVGQKALYVRSGSRSRSRSRERHQKRTRDRDYSRSRSRSRSRDRYKSRSRSRERSHYRKSSRSRSRDRGGKRRSSPHRSHKRSRSRSRSPDRDRRRRSRSSQRRKYSRSRSRDPDIDRETERLVRTVANRVKEHGKHFEEMLKHKEKSNPKFQFLFDDTLPAYNLFYSMVDPDFRRKSTLPTFDDEGYNSVYSTDSAEESERDRIRKGTIGKLALRRFEGMLRALSGRRGDMARCMAFSLEHAEAAPQVADIITSSLLVESTAVPRKVARLHLICDILHNSAASVPSAWKFRQEFQSRLPRVFDHLSTIYQSFPGRITAETFKKQILAVVEVWEAWIVFTPDFTNELRARLDGLTGKPAEQETEAIDDKQSNAAPSVAAKFKASSFMPASDPMPATGFIPLAEPKDDVDGMAVDDVDGEPIDGEPTGEGDSLDGDPIDGDPINGDPMDGDSVDGDPIDGEPVDDVDGQSVDMDEDVDGEPVPT
ncbi:hypothetical protein BOTBODRAFT_123385 [Botryobasidium botryosum FD-172 SS1]|uniref:U2 snRNP-associated SURP motif-containing protein n=1 Tax=Botryobasidium botryosum (strain FD-172 SS1) TaxID=930990 RepID=A0A067N148_BOTB1|nr:hypothetical protein BOTBODRAFT_123385 [Botryobasidium botryosum FD-172 SS1]